MKKVVFNTVKYLAFLAIGILIFWLLYRELEWDKLQAALRELKYGFIVLSVLLSLLAHLSRAWRWKMLIRPMGYDPRTSNTFLSILVLYFVNLIVPRAGEVARCTVLAQTDDVPFTKLIGTVVVERIADFLMLIILAIFIFASNIGIVTQFFAENIDLESKIDTLLIPKNIVIAAGIVIVLAFLSVFAFKKIMKSKLKEKIIQIKNQFVEGIQTIAKMRRKWLFIFHTCFIFFLWLVMLYLVFLAYEPTENLTMRVGMLTFLMGGLAMLAPVQGGIGPWHWMVVQTLLLFGIAEDEGKIFAAVAHTSTNLIYLIIGGLALVYLLIKYGRKNIRLTQQNAVEINQG